MADRQAVPAEPAVPAVLPARGVPPAPAAVINATVSTGNSTGIQFSTYSMINNQELLLLLLLLLLQFNPLCNHLS